MIRYRHLAVGLVALATVALLAVACGGGSESGGASGEGGVATRPIEEILVGEIHVTNLTATSAAVEVETSLPVVCSVVYGPTTAYGAQSTDPEMGGLPHRDHGAPLRGLAPETTYHFRLQGTGSDGTVYVSRDLTLTTPAETAAAAGAEGASLGANVASGAAGARVADASSTFGDSPAWAPENAIDGDPATQWSSAGDGDGAFITVELAAATSLAGVGVWTRTMGSSAQITRFRVVTDDGTALGPFDVPTADRLYTFPVDVEARTLRFEVVASSGGNTGLVEVAAFARP